MIIVLVGTDDGEAGYRCDTACYSCSTRQPCEMLDSRSDFDGDIRSTICL